jgi:hypothetical protein
MRNHLDKKELDKLNRIKQNSSNESLQRSVSDKIKVLKGNKTILK